MNKFPKKPVSLALSGLMLAGTSAQAASPFEFERWISQSNNPSKSQFPLRTGAPGGGLNLAGNQQGGNNQGGGNNKKPDINFNTDVNAPNPTQNSAPLQAGQWVVFASSSYGGYGAGPYGGDAGRTLFGSLALTESTINQPQPPQPPTQEFVCQAGGDCVGIAAPFPGIIFQPFPTANADGSVELTLNDPGRNAGPNNNINSGTISASGNARVVLTNNQGPGVRPFISAYGTGFDGTPQGQGQGGTEISSRSVLIDEDGNVLQLQGTFFDSAPNGQTFAADNFWTQKDLRNPTPSFLTYGFVAGNPTTSAQMTAAQGMDFRAEGGVGHATFTGRSLQGKHNVNLDVNLNNASWTGAFTTNSLSPSFNASGTITGANFTSTAVTGGPDVDTTHAGNGVSGSFFGNKLQAAGGIYEIKNSQGGITKDAFSACNDATRCTTDN